MWNITLCIRARREVRNFASQEFRLTPDPMQSSVFDIDAGVRVQH